MVELCVRGEFTHHGWHYTIHLLLATHAEREHCFSSSDNWGEMRLCIEHTISRMPLSASSSHDCRYVGLEVRKVYLIYMWVNHFRPNMDSFLGVNLYVGRLMRECVYTVYVCRDDTGSC